MVRLVVVEWTSENLKNAGSHSSKGMSYTGSHTGDHAHCDQALSTIASVLFVNDDDGGRSKCRICGQRSSGEALPGTVIQVPRDIRTRGGMYDYKPCKGVLRTASKKLLPRFAMRKLPLAFQHQNPACVVLNEIFHVPQVKHKLVSLRVVDKGLWTSWKRMVT